MKKLIKNSFVFCICILSLNSFAQKEKCMKCNLQKLFCNTDSNYFHSLLKDISYATMRSENCLVIDMLEYRFIIVKSKNITRFGEVFPNSDTIYLELNNPILQNRIYYNEIDRMKRLFNFCIENRIFTIHYRDNNRISFEFSYCEVVYDKLNKPLEYKTEFCNNWYLIEKKR
jgi:hypothetical protein